MKNYLYKVNKREIILSEEEHNKIKEGQENGIDIVYLRNDTLGIKPRMVDFFEETNQPTKIEEQEVVEKMRNTFKLQSPTKGSEDIQRQNNIDWLN